MKKISSPSYSEDPEYSMYDSENSIALPDNDGSLENMNSLMNPYVKVHDEEGADYSGGFSESLFSPLNMTDDDIIDLANMSDVFLSKVGKDSTVLSWGPHTKSFLDKISSKEINVISLDGSKRVINYGNISQRYSDPMFFSSRKKADGFFNPRPFVDAEQADIAIKNIYSNLRPVSYSLITADNSINIEESIKKSGFFIEGKISGKTNKYLLKKNELQKTALIKSYSKDLKSMFVFRCDIADSVEEKTAGLQPYEGLSKKCGLLFRYDKPKTLNFHMASVKFPIDIMFLDENFEIKKVYSNIQPGSLDIFSCSNAKYVLETLGGIAKSADLSLGKRLFVDFSPKEDIIKKESDILNGLGISNYIIKKTAFSRSSLETFDKYSIFISGPEKSPLTSMVKEASLKDEGGGICIFNLNDIISNETIPLNRIGSANDYSARLSLFSGLSHTSGDFIKVSFNDFAKSNFYSKLSSKYFAGISDVIYSVNNNNPDLVSSLNKAASSNEKIAFVYSGKYDPVILRECLEVTVNSRFGSNLNLSDADCFRVPAEYGPEEIVLAAEYRYGNIPTKVFSNAITKQSGIPVPDATKNIARKSIRYINRAKKLCNNLIDNLNKNLSVYEKLREKQDAIRSSSGEYSESCKRNARVAKRILLNTKEVIGLLASIQDVSTTEETIGSLADTSKTFSESIKGVFDLLNIIDTDSFSDGIVEMTGKANGSIDDLKITLDRCKNYVSRDILGIVIISE